MKIVITGSCGLIGSEAVAYFSRQNHEILGIDNNMRREFFGPTGDTNKTLEWLKTTASQFRHLCADIRDREIILQLFLLIFFLPV